MQKLLTISVAAYNVEKFLENTLQLLSDERFVNDLEVFIIDDGGRDRSFEIAASFEKRFPGTFHAVHKENGGYGSTVNYSLAHATGKYFRLLDGDDWLDPDGLDAVLHQLEKCQEDVVITDYYAGPDKESMKLIPTREKDNAVLSVKKHATSFPYGMWSIFYKTNLLKECKLALPEHSLYTDQIYSTVPFSVAEQIRVINIPVYCYRIGREEQSTSKASRIKHAEEMLNVCDFLYDFYETNKSGNRYLFSRVSRYYIVALKTLMIFPVTKENKKRYIEYERQMKSDHPDLYYDAVNNNSAGFFIRLLRLTGYKTYWLLRIIPEKNLV